MIVWELEIRVGLVGGGGISGRPKILLAEVEEAIKQLTKPQKQLLIYLQPCARDYQYCTMTIWLIHGHNDLRYRFSCDRFLQD